MPSQETVPLVILAGSDRRPGPVPRGAEGLHFIVGYKGAELRLAGRPLARILAERVLESGAAEPVYVAGPARVYRGLVECPIIDTDADVGGNIRRAIEAVRERHGRETAIALMACDILPAVEEIRSLMGEFLAPSSRGEPPAVALPLVRVDEDLGASGWKPRYGLRVDPKGPPVHFLPGHLGVVRPQFLRLGLVYRLLALAYRERNRDFGRRRREILPRALALLLRRDLANLLRGRPPTLTYTVLRYGLGAFRLWRRGELDVGGLARSMAAVFVRRRHFRRLGADAVRLVTCAPPSFAKDIDTVEELEEFEAGVKSAHRNESP